MPSEILLPGVQDQRERRRAAEPARVGGKVGERRRRHGKEQLVHRPRALSDEPVEGVRQGEHHMEIRHRQELLAPFRQPVFLGSRLTLRAVPVATRVIDVANHPATVAGLDMAAEERRATGDDRPPDFRQARRQSAPGEERRPVSAEDLGQGHGR